MIHFGKTGISAGVGIGDLAFEYWDEKSGRTEPFRNATDIARLIEAGLGYVVQVFWPRQGAWGEALALSATPLLIRSVYKPIKEAMTTTAQKAYVPRKRAPTPSGTPPLAGGGNVITPQGEEVIMSVT